MLALYMQSMSVYVKNKNNESTEKHVMKNDTLQTNPHISPCNQMLQNATSSPNNASNITKLEHWV